MSKLIKPYAFVKMKNMEDFQKTMQETGINVPCSKNLKVLSNPLEIDGKIMPNRLCVQPCEGFDGTLDGRPTEAVRTRYGNYARGGSGVLWYEAIAVSDEGKCNPHQMILNEDTVVDLKKLVDDTCEIAMKTRGIRPYNIVQLTHSGRSSVDQEWNQIPLIAFPDPNEDPYYSNITVASDERLEQLRDEMIKAAELSVEVGFDAVDIKICHGYIMRELLAGFTRPGKYGGSYENRTRLLFEVIHGIRERVGNQISICVRLNAYDCISYPYGWGMVKEDGVMDYDLSEPIRLIKDLVSEGIKLFNISTMKPRFSPKNRGFQERHTVNVELNPYENTALLLQATKEIKEAVPEALLVATGLSWFDCFGGYIGAGGIEEGWFDIAGFGRQAMAYPDYASDLLDYQMMRQEKCCVTCDKCYALAGLHENVGCVARDHKYLAIYLEAIQNKGKVIVNKTTGQKDK